MKMKTKTLEDDPPICSFSPRKTQPHGHPQSGRAGVDNKSRKQRARGGQGRILHRVQSQRGIRRLALFDNSVIFGGKSNLDVSSLGIGFRPVVGEPMRSGRAVGPLSPRRNPNWSLVTRADWLNTVPRIREKFDLGLALDLAQLHWQLLFKCHCTSNIVYAANSSC